MVKATLRILAAVAGVAACIRSSSAFVPVVGGGQYVQQPRTSLMMSSENGGETGAVGGDKAFAASAVAAAYILSNVFAVDAAFAAPSRPDIAGSSEIIAARSGGRTGGRSSAARAPSRPSPTRVYSGGTTVVTPPTTMVTPVYTPPVVVSPFGYNPMGGFGMGYGLGAMNSIGSEFREMREQQEIAQSKAELQQARQKEAELEARLRSLESAQTQQAISAQMKQ